MQDTTVMATFATVRIEAPAHVDADELADRLTEAARQVGDVMVYVEDFGQREATDPEDL